MNILIANVGNCRRAELRELALALNEHHKVTVATMSEDRAFRAQAFTLSHAPTRMAQIPFDGKIDAYEFYTHPADATSIMLGGVMRHERPDLVICGFSNGTHMGSDIYVSSNIGMATEATYFGVPAIAIGVARRVGGHTKHTLKPAIQWVVEYLHKLTELEIPPRTLLNVNIPHAETYDDIKGVRVTSMGNLSAHYDFIEKTDPDGRKYYWGDIKPRTKRETDTDTDAYWFDKGYVSVTPINYDATHHESVEHWGGVIKEIIKEAKIVGDSIALPDNFGGEEGGK